MKSICDALLGRKEADISDLDFDMDRELERQAEQLLDRDCIAEIDRAADAIASDTAPIPPRTNPQSPR